MNHSYDIVIIGGGIAGAMLAHRLSSETPGLRIIMLEAGTDRSSERTTMSLDYAASVVKGPYSAYNKNPDILLESPGDIPGYFAPGSDTFKSTYLRTAGGTTWHWLGNTPRHLPNDFRLNSVYGKGVDWPISYEDLEPFYSQAEKEMGVSGDHLEWNNLVEGAFRSSDFPMPKIWPSYLETVLKKRIHQSNVEGETIVVRSTPQARNSQAYEDRPACAGNSSCVPICPIQAKYDATVHLKKAIKSGVKVQYEAIVNRIETIDNKITKVHFKNWAGETEVVEGSIFVLAAHAIESAVLLLFNGLANSSGLVGKNLMDHPQGYGVGVYSEPLYTFRGPPTTSGIDCFRDGEFRRDTAAFRISIGNDGWGRFMSKNNQKKIDNLEFLIEEKFGDKNFQIGKPLRKAIEEKLVRTFRFSYSTEMLPNETNKVELGCVIDPLTSLPRPLIHFKIDVEDTYNNNGFKKAARVLTSLFQIAGVADQDFEVQDSNSIYSGAGHIMGTLRMGNDPKTSITNPDCRCHDHPNLYLIGSGLFPTSATANPTLTIAALSLRLAKKLSDNIQTRNP